VTIANSLAKLVAYCLSIILRKLSWQRLFTYLEKRGFHIIPNHYYQPIPDTRLLPSKLWRTKSELAGIDMNEKTQIEFLTNVVPIYQKETNFPRTKSDFKFYLENATFGPVDAEILHCMIRHFKPKKIVEIGSGFSTLISANAVSLNRKENVITELFAIEPYPNDVLKRGINGLTKLIQKKLEQVDLNFFLELDENDILFIDSTHVVKTGGDVNNIYLEILPRLKKGVFVHIHDIFFPYEYPKKWLFQAHRFWTEQYLLQAFLVFNNAYEVHWASFFMHTNHPAKLASHFPNYKNKQVWESTNHSKYAYPASFWIRKIR